MRERFRWLAAAIAAHPDRKVVGRTRLQKEIKLLQRLKFPTEYGYTLHFYGPYSEGLQAEIGLLESLGLVEEVSQVSQDGAAYYILRAKPEAELADISPFQRSIDQMDAAQTVVLELAATYDMFRTMGSDHEESLLRLRRKKGEKCSESNVTAALGLLKKLGLPTG